MNRHGNLSSAFPSQPTERRRLPGLFERQNAMEEARVIKSVMPGRCSELLALRDFGIGVRFNEIQGAVGREAKVDARVSIEPQCSVDPFRCSLNAACTSGARFLAGPSTIPMRS